MPQTVEISLRIPSLTLPNQKERTNNDSVRFITHVEVASIPKADDMLTVPVANGTLECRVVRSTWEESRNCFMVSCQFARRSIAATEYEALMNSENWHVRELP